MTDEIIFLAPLPVLRKRTRLAKMVSVLLARSLRVRFFGWERVAGEVANSSWGQTGVREEPMMRGGGYASLQARALYPLWMVKVFWRTLRLGRGRLLFCLGLETALPALLAARFTGARVVFDDADRFSMIIRLTGIAGRLLSCLEQWASRRATLHIIPGLSRYEHRHDRMIVLCNSPLTSEFEAAERSCLACPNAKFVLYANGWVGETRGAPIFLRMLDIAQERGLDIAMVIAGRVDGPTAARLIAHPKVIFLGEVSQREALAWYGPADVVLTYYDPAVPINRKAESNKWGDAIYCGCPIIVNSEVETAKFLVDAGAAFTAPYADAEALANLVEWLAVNLEPLANASHAVATLRTHYPPFDQQFAEIIKFLSPEHEQINDTL